MYKLLNRASRIENFDIIFKFRFVFIKDLHDQLTKLHSEYIELLLQYKINVLSWSINVKGRIQQIKM